MRVPLVTTGPTLDAEGRPAPHRFAVRVRNMFEKDRAGSPGPLAHTTTGSMPNSRQNCTSWRW